MIRIFAALVATMLVVGCTPTTPDEPLADLGAFRLGHNIVIADNLQKVPGSRDASKKEWTDALTRAVEERFGQYQGDQLYHFGISIEGYNLATGGVPLVFTPKSVLAVNVTIWDDAAGAKLNSEVEQFTIFETTSAESAVVGSGYTRSKEEQVLGLARNAVGQIEDWMIAQRKAEGWFDSRPGAATDAVVVRPLLVDTLDEDSAPAPDATQPVQDPAANAPLDSAAQNG
ncbi:hypothetical protein QEZ52_03565 [Aliisedimentitalea scapharcae]|uniref:Lipoprotein n=1 Tax=Aliisedimentitalea scapharcae TaxID=1524259 RepID=A0ABZ2XUT8_9RHOB